MHLQSAAMTGRFVRVAALLFLGACVHYQTTPLRKPYQGEETGVVWGSKVEYLTPTQRVAYEITVRDGKLYTADGALLTTGRRGAIFVMTEEGRLYAAPDIDPGYFHHSSFVAGAPVAGAGELYAKEGTLTEISDQSGHYEPGPEFTAQVLRRLRDLGVDLSQVVVRRISVGEYSAMDYLSDN